MAHLVKSSTGQQVDVDDADRQLLGYYRGEGFVPADSTEQQPAAEVDDADDGRQDAGTDLTV